MDSSGIQTIRRVARTLVLVLGLGVTLVAAAAHAGNKPSYGGEEPGISDPNTREDSFRGTQLLISRAITGGPANAAAEQPAFSQDSRTAIAIAYVSAATDITGQSGGGHKNVYLANRKRPYDNDANQPWELGSTILVSRGQNAPNGDSWAPTLSGDDRNKARCLVFLSSASNLVSGDRNRHTDIFIRKLNGRGVKRVESNGVPSSIAVDGPCKHIAYTSTAGVFVKTIGGGSERVFRGGGGSGASIDAYGGAVSFARGGSVYFWKRGKGLRKVGAGSSPRMSASGKIVVFERGDSVFSSRTSGGGQQQIGPGVEPALTTVGSFIFWINGSLVDATGLHKPAASCDGGPRSPATSAHGNYVLYLCPAEQSLSGHQLWVSYIGGK